MFTNTFLIINFVKHIFCANHDGNPNVDPNVQKSRETELKLSELWPQVNQLKDSIREQLDKSKILPFNSSNFMAVFDIQARINEIKEDGPWSDFVKENSTVMRLEETLLSIFKSLKVNYYELFFDKYTEIKTDLKHDLITKRRELGHLKHEVDQTLTAMFNFMSLNNNNEKFLLFKGVKIYFYVQTTSLKNLLMKYLADY
ncbi:hypothetical protein EHP00_1722 [Ecytonucleospora hepatopenaei]|uniref:Uncharacterized protein n=1 Tax=Ecytonucleospora hepatopenaei TaxID=646526 RepID=A0A1W0E666_9MICR|nr:hypothetical protein EHP00_1722 [Ecytonucleospora hepatopenaei]